MLDRQAKGRQAGQAGQGRLTDKHSRTDDVYDTDRPLLEAFALALVAAVDLVEDVVTHRSHLQARAVRAGPGRACEPTTTTTPVQVR